MSLHQVAQRLGSLAGRPVRSYSTFDFGREQDPTARSVVAPPNLAYQILEEIRKDLEPGLIAFVGTSSWYGNEKHDGQEIVVANGQSQFDTLRVARFYGCDYDLGIEGAIAKLTEFDRAFGIDIFQVEPNRICFSLQRMPEDLEAFCEEVYQFCPDIVDQGCGTIEKLADEIQTGLVYLWWD